MKKPEYKKEIYKLLEGTDDAELKNLPDSSESINRIFHTLVKFAREALIQYSGVIKPVCVLIGRNYKEDLYDIMKIPMNLESNVSTIMTSTMLRNLVKDLKTGDKSERKLVGLIMIMTGEGFKVSKEWINSDGTHKKGAFENTDATNNLICKLEEEFTEYDIVTEFIVGDHGDVVINDKPIFEGRRLFNEIEQNNTEFGFIFTEGAGLN